MTHIGFTGTRGQVTEAQKLRLQEVLKSLKESSWTTLHHGDCRGADALAAEVAYTMGLWVVAHPPINPAHRAFTNYVHEVREPKDYLVRDRDIVRECQYLIAVPAGTTNQRRSGTWYTIRQARAAKRAGVIIFPDGRTETL